MLIATPSEAIQSVLRSWVDTDPCVVVAGHYSLADYMSDVSNEGEAEAMTFDVGVGLVAQAIDQGRACHLVVLVNDIGVSTDQRGRLKDGYELPVNYRQTMVGAGLDESHLSVVFESTMRNKASTTLRKVYKRQPHLFERVSASDARLVRCVDRSVCDAQTPAGATAYVVPGPDGEKLVVKEGPNPKCNLIMATFFHDLTKNHKPRGIINIFNELYAYRLKLGIHVSRLIFDNQTPFMNVYCDGEELLTDADEVRVRKEEGMA